MATKRTYSFKRKPTKVRKTAVRAAKRNIKKRSRR